MKLLVKKQGVKYGVNGSDTAITDLANILTLKEGSFLMAFDNGVVIKADGTFTGDAGTKCNTFAMINGKIRSAVPIVVGQAKILEPMPDHAAAKKVATFNIVKPASITVDSHTGLTFIDADKHLRDSTRRKDVTVYTDEDTVQSDLDKLRDHVAALDFVDTCTLGSNTLTITYMQDANISITGLGEFLKREETVTTKLSYGDALSYEQMVEFARMASPQDGNRDGGITGDLGTFTKDYGIEDYMYLVFGIGFNTSMYSTGKPDRLEYGAVSYIAIPEGDLADTNEGFMDILKAATTGVSNDSGGAGTDASDN